MTTPVENNLSTADGESLAASIAQLDRSGWLDELRPMRAAQGQAEPLCEMGMLPIELSAPAEPLVLGLMLRRIPDGGVLVTGMDGQVVFCASTVEEACEYAEDALSS